MNEKKKRKRRDEEERKKIIKVQSRRLSIFFLSLLCALAPSLCVLPLFLLLCLLVPPLCAKTIEGHRPTEEWIAFPFYSLSFLIYFFLFPPRANNTHILYIIDRQTMPPALHQSKPYSRRFNLPSHCLSLSLSLSLIHSNAFPFPLFFPITNGKARTKA